MSTEGKKKKIIKRSSLRAVLTHRRERDGGEKSSATPPPVPSDLMWEISIERREFVEKEISDLKSANSPKADALEDRRKKIEAKGDAKPEEALNELAELQTAIIHAKEWNTKLPLQVSTDSDIKTLEQANYAKAGAFRGEYDNLGTQSDTDPKAAISALTALSKSVAVAVDWVGTGARQNTVEQKVALLKTQGVDVDMLEKTIGEYQNFGPNKPNMALQRLKNAEKMTNLAEQRLTDAYKEYSVLSKQYGGDATRMIKKHAAKGYGDPAPDPLPDLLKTVKEKSEAVVAATANDDFITAHAEIRLMADAMDIVRKHEYDRAKDIGEQLRKDHPKKSDARKHLTKAAVDDPRILFELCGTPEGRTMIDELVEDLGTKVTSKEDKKFLAEALKGRYGLEVVDGDLTTKALPQLYKLFKDVPIEHTHNNMGLKKLRRNKGSEEASYYKDNQIVLNLKKTSSTSMSFDNDDAQDQGSEGEQINYFNHTTLHEIGHAVDAGMGYMTSNGKNKDHGGWSPASIGEIVDRVANDGKWNFLNKWSDVLPEKFLKEYLRMALNGKKATLKLAQTVQPDAIKNDPAMIAAQGELKNLDKKKPDKNKITDEAKLEKANDVYKSVVKRAVEKSLSKMQQDDEGLKGLLKLAIEKLFEDPKHDVDKAIAAAIADNGMPDVPEDVDWDELAKDDAVKWCDDVRLHGDSDGLWEKGPKAKDFALSDGRIYQQSYSTEWYSYDAGARSTGISSYQFRSPVEWFAECYAAHYLGKLPGDHVVAKYLKKLQGQT